MTHETSLSFSAQLLGGADRTLRVIVMVATWSVTARADLVSFSANRRSKAIV